MKTTEKACKFYEVGGCPALYACRTCGLLTTRLGNPNCTVPVEEETPESKQNSQPKEDTP